MKILQKDEKVLHEKAKNVPIKEIESPKVKKIISEMKRLLEAEPDGVAIAAPQIGEPLAIFVVSHRVFDILEDATVIDNDAKENTNLEKKDLVFINPEIIKTSKQRAYMEEGCLSVRWLYGKVSRAKKAKVRAFNEHGVKFELGASGLLAQVFQHECDHLSGILFVEKAKDLHELPEEEVKRIKSEHKHEK